VCDVTQGRYPELAVFRRLLHHRPEAEIHPARSVRVEFPRQIVEWIFWIFRHAQVVVGEIREQGRRPVGARLAGVAGGAVALFRILEERQPALFRRGKRHQLFEEEVILGAERIDLRRHLVGSDRFRGQVVGAIHFLQRVGPEHFQKQRGIGRLADLRHDRRGIRIGHLQ